jgi:hypothetical protein
MRDLSDWLDSCFDQSDDFAPVRAYIFGAILTSVPAVITALVVDPRDFQLLASLLAGAVLLGGGSAAMFAFPPGRFCRLCILGLELNLLLPLRKLAGPGWTIFILSAFGLFVAIIAAASALRVLWLTTLLIFGKIRSGATPNDTRRDE